MFVLNCWDYVPSKYVPEYHRTGSLLAMVLTLLSFMYCSFSDPGIVNPDTYHLYDDNYPYDNMIFSEKKCRTCKITKPARSKHCSICNRCVSRFDHHCVWVNNCVGEKNQGKFIMFLFTTAALATYTTAGLCVIVWTIIEEEGVLDIMLRNKITGEISPLPWGHFIALILYHAGHCISLLFFASVMGMVLHCFAGYHLWLVIRNTTTSETFKWNDLQEDINFARTVLRKIVARNSKRKAGLPDEDSDKTEVSLFGSGASVNLRKSLYLKTGVDIEEFSEESKHRISQVTPRKTNPRASSELESNAENTPGGRSLSEAEETSRGVVAEDDRGEVIALSEDKANEVFIQEMQRLSALTMQNSYDRGILPNLWQIFFPISLRKTLRVPMHTKSE